VRHDDIFLNDIGDLTNRARKPPVSRSRRETPGWEPGKITMMSSRSAGGCRHRRKLPRTTDPRVDPGKRFHCDHGYDEYQIPARPNVARNMPIACGTSNQQPKCTNGQATRAAGDRLEGLCQEISFTQASMCTSSICPGRVAVGDSCLSNVVLLRPLARTSATRVVAVKVWVPACSPSSFQIRVAKLPRPTGLIEYSSRRATRPKERKKAS